MTDIRNRFRSEFSMDIYEEFKAVDALQEKEYEKDDMYQDDHDFRARMVLANSMGLAQAVIAERNREIATLKEELAYSNSRMITKTDWEWEQNRPGTAQWERDKAAGDRKV